MYFVSDIGIELQENTAYAVVTHELQDKITTLKDFELHENAAYISTTYVRTSGEYCLL